MAESRSGGEKGKKVLSFAAKKARRVQQKMLEKVGKTEKTTDDNYTEFVVNFNKQQLAAARLQKELSKYSASLKTLSTNTKSLFDVWMEYYEPQWVGQTEVAEIIENKMLLWEDLLNRVHSDMVEQLQHYMSKFPETKRVVEKRERKIVDYDYAKRVLEDTRQKQKVNDMKIQQAEESYQQAKQAFDEVTSNLYEELPMLYDSRIDFYSKFFSSMTSIETKFHEEMAKLDSRYNEIMSKLAEEAESGKHTSKKERVTDVDNSFANLTPHKESDGESHDTSSVNGEDPRNLGDENPSESFVSAQGDDSNDTTSADKVSPAKVPPSKPLRTDEFLNADDVSKKDDTTNPELETNIVDTELLPDKDDTTSNNNGSNITVEDQPDAAAGVSDPSKSTTLENGSSPEKEISTNNASIILQKRTATHPYTGEDEDELSFDKGDVILVIPYESQDDEEDEGWLMGIVESTGKKGLFPENFTKLLQ